MSLLAYWPLEADSKDLTGNGHDGVDTNVTYGAPAPFGASAAQFPGPVGGTPPNKIVIPSLSLSGGAWSINVWCYPTANSINPYEMLFGKNYPGSGNSGCGLYFASVSGASTQFAFGEFGNLKTFQLNPSSGLNNPYCIGVSSAGPGAALKCYINGALIQTFATTTFANFNPDIIGRDASDPSGSTGQFKGGAKAIGVWVNEVLSDAQFAALYNGGAGLDPYDPAFPDHLVVPHPLAPAYSRQLKALFPPGVAFDLETDSVISQTCDALAVELDRVDARGVDLIDEADPRTTDELIGDWERVLGLPDAQVPVISSDLDERRAAVTAKYVARGGQSFDFFAQLVAACGYTLASIDTYGGSRFTCVSLCTDPLIEGAYAYSMNLNVNAPAGSALTHAELEAVIRKATHSHITAFVTYL